MSESNGVRQTLPVLVWWTGVAISFGLVLAGWFATNLSNIPPMTPFDNTGSGHAEQWSFLREASALVPADSTFTIEAPDPDTEMSLYMMAVGLLPGSTAIPGTYYGQPVAAASARFVLAFGVDHAGSVHPDRTTAVTDGFVTDRRPRDR